MSEELPESNGVVEAPDLGAGTGSGLLDTAAIPAGTSVLVAGPAMTGK